MPTDTPPGTPRGQTAATALRILSATCCASGGVAPARNTANSSPPIRTTRSARRTQPCTAVATRRSNSSPEASLFYAIYLFQQAFRQFDFGFAAAMAWLLFVIIMIITVIQVKFGNKFVYYEADR